MRSWRWAGFAIVLALLAGSTWALVRNPFSTPDDALAAFYGGEPRHECELADPLRRAGKAVVPLIIAELPNRSMRRRRYAIAFLGDGGYREALPLLELIARDETERDHFRGDALLAIANIDLELARRITGDLVAPTAHLSWIAKIILQGGPALAASLDPCREWR